MKNLQDIRGLSQSEYQILKTYDSRILDKAIAALEKKGHVQKPYDYLKKVCDCIIAEQQKTKPTKGKIETVTSLGIRYDKGCNPPAIKKENSVEAIKRIEEWENGEAGKIFAQNFGTELAHNLAAILKKAHR